MKYVEFDQTRPMDLILLGRVAIDFNPAYNDQVKEEFKPLKDVHTFEKFVGGSPANIAVGVTRHGLKAGFLGKVSDDQFGDYVTEYFDKQGIDTSHITRCTNGEKLGLTFTEMLSEKESHILMYRNCIADLQLHVDDIDEDYIKQSKAILISGTALAESPSREAAIKAVMLAKKNDTKVIFDVDYREYNWKNSDEISIYYSIVAKEADIIMGSREEFDLTEKLIKKGMTDEESASLWQGYNAKIVVIKHGMKAGFLGKVSDDQFGDYVTEYFDKQGIDTSHITRCTNGEKLGLTFTEMLSEKESHILMYRNCIADLQLHVDDIDEDYIKQSKAILISGTALAESPSREAAIKAVMLAKKNDTKVIFDVDYREYNWKNSDEISIYYSIVAKEADIIMGSREEFDLTEKLIKKGMTDEESASLWQGYNAKIVVIKHGMKGSTAYTCDGQKFSIKPFPVEARKGFGGGDGYGSGFLYGLYQGWEVIDCLEFGSAEASMMVRSNNCSDSLPGPDAVHAFIKEEKEKFGEMIARV